LLALRQVLAWAARAGACEQVTCAESEHAFDDMDELTDARAANQLKVVVQVSRYRQAVWHKIGCPDGKSRVSFAARCAASGNDQGGRAVSLDPRER
jgi:hypothetical protein